MSWRVPCLWPGETFFILGGGESLKGFDAEILRGRGRVIAINEAGLAVEPDAADARPHAPWADVLYWADKRWFNWNHHRLASHTGALKVCRFSPEIDGHPKLGAELAARHDIKVLPPSQDDLVEDGGSLAGFDSGGAGINLAYLLGARERGRVALLGFDMRGGNWHARHQKGTDRNRYQTHFMPPIARMAWPLRQQGVEVLNCTPGSALTCFPFARLEDLLMDAEDKTNSPAPAPQLDEVEQHVGLELCASTALEREIGRLAAHDALSVRVRLQGADVITRRSAGWWQLQLSLAFSSVVVASKSPQEAVFACRKL